MALKVIAIDKENSRAKVELNGEVRELPYRYYENNDCYVITGIAVRYRTGKKIWNGNFTFWPASGNINNIHSPMDHRASRPAIQVVGFYGETAEPLRSKHIQQEAVNSRVQNAVNAAKLRLQAAEILLSAKGFSCHECGHSFVYRSLSEKANPNGVEPKDMVPAYCANCGTELSEAEPFEITETELKFAKGGN